MNVSVFGLGHAGCVTAACLARCGHQVWAVDASPEVVDMVNSGRAPIEEPGLAQLLADVVGNGRLRAGTDVASAVRNTDVALVCIETRGSGAGLSGGDALADIGEQIGMALRGRTRAFTVVLRSTVLPGSTERVLVPVLRNAAEACDVHVAVNPEFMREGSAIHDFEHPPFVLVGCDGLGTASLVRDLYADVTAPLVKTSPRTAELVKHASHAFQSLKVCFANEMGNLCDAFGADSQEVMRIFAMDRSLNLSEAYLKPGFAFGGSSLPKDVMALVWAAQDSHVDVPLLSAIMPSNEGQIRSAVNTVLRAGKRRVGVVGLGLHSGTNDRIESPIATLIETLIDKGCDVRALGLKAGVETVNPRIAAVLCDDVETVVHHAEVLVVGRATDEAARALGLVGPDCIVVDLTRGAMQDEHPWRPAASPTWTPGRGRTNGSSWSPAPIVRENAHVRGDRPHGA